METKLQGKEKWFNMDDSVLVYSDKGWLEEKKIYKTRKGSYVINDVHVQAPPKSCSLMARGWRLVDESEVNELIKKTEETKSHNEKEV